MSKTLVRRQLEALQSDLKKSSPTALKAQLAETTKRSRRVNRKKVEKKEETTQTTKLGAFLLNIFASFSW